MNRSINTFTVNVQNPNVQISAFSDLVGLLNRSDFRRSVPNIVRSVPNIVHSVLFSSPKLDRFIYKEKNSLYIKQSSLGLKMNRTKKYKPNTILFGLSDRTFGFRTSTVLNIF